MIQECVLCGRKLDARRPTVRIAHGDFACRLCVDREDLVRVKQGEPRLPRTMEWA